MTQILSFLLAVTLLGCLMGCQTIQGKAQRACAYQTPVAVANQIVGVLTGPLGVLGAQAVNAGEAAGCAALAAGH